MLLIFKEFQIYGSEKKHTELFWKVCTRYLGESWKSGMASFKSQCGSERGAVRQSWVSKSEGPDLAVPLSWPLRLPCPGSLYLASFHLQGCHLVTWPAFTLQPHLKKMMRNPHFSFLVLNLLWWQILSHHVAVDCVYFTFTPLEFCRKSMGVFDDRWHLRPWWK